MSKNFYDSKKNSPKDFHKIPDKPAQSTLRISGGIYKGRKLQMASLGTTRSSKSILKESFFNTLGFQIVGASFVEFFAGSGSVGIEALSRGAKSALFFEYDSKACEVLSFNLRTICQNNEDYQVIWGDTFCHYSSVLKNFRFPVIGYLDPPFPRENFQDIYPKCYQMIENLDRSLFALLVLEHISSLEIPSNIGPFVLTKTKKFGKSSLSYFE